MARRPAPSRRRAIAAPTALLRIEWDGSSRIMKAKTSPDATRRRFAPMAVALIGIGLSLGACVHDQEVATASDFPADSRLRHPIAIEEAKTSTVVFVGQGRGGLTAEQRADVLNLAQPWSHEGT